MSEEHTWLLIRPVEIYDVSAVAMALLGYGACYRINNTKKTTHWYEVWVKINKKGEELKKYIEFTDNLIIRAMGVANSTPLLEIKDMSTCCAIGILALGDPCPYCGAKKRPKKTGEPPWRIPRKDGA
jgi:hypothetical protein